MKEIKNLFSKLNEVKRWKVYIYYNGILIKTKKVKKDTLKDLKNEKYIITIFNKRQLFRSMKVNIVVRPAVLLQTDMAKKRIYIGVVMEEGQKL